MNKEHILLRVVYSWKYPSSGIYLYSVVERLLSLKDGSYKVKEHVGKTARELDGISDWVHDANVDIVATSEVRIECATRRALMEACWKDSLEKQSFSLDFSPFKR